MERQRGTQLVFLNDCLTVPQVEQLLHAGVSDVIATSQAIDDNLAKEFAVLFYRSLGDGASIDTAFHEASAAVRTIRGNRTRGLYVLEVDGKPAPQAARAV